MKKILTISVSSLMLAASMSFGAFAVGTGTSTHDVTVGAVDETIYSVDISWGDLTFDWKYDESTNSFDFKPQTRETCYPGIYNNNSGGGNSDDTMRKAQTFHKLYFDAGCTQLNYNQPLSSGTTYYVSTSIPKSTIMVEDKSTNGQVQVSGAFTPEDGYDWVIGKFGTWNAPYTPNDTTSNGEYTFSEFAAGNVFIQGPHYGHVVDGSLKLEKNPEATIEAGSVATGDKIGTVTLTISPDV